MLRLTAEGTVPTGINQWNHLDLPAPKLKELRTLQLSSIGVQLLVHSVSTACGSSKSSSGSSDAAAAILPQLQDLELSRCRLTLQSLSDLLSATALTRLQWQNVELSQRTAKPL